ncbi:MAG: hypothetical protein V4484_14125 [Pseudomonadota bacterium]
MTITIDVVLFSYLDRPIYDVYVGKREVGVAGPYPHNGRGTMAGVQFPKGPQSISWRLDGPEGTPGNGEKVTSKNAPVLDDVPAGARFLAIHINPDNTVDFIFTPHFPGLSPQGEKFHTAWEARNGK